MSDGGDTLPYAHGGPVLRGRLRAQPEDFCVDEELGYEPDGSGEHAFVRVEKRGANTEWVARQLARHAGVGPAAVGFAGLKDRHAVTRQTFSVHLPGRPDPDWSLLAGAEFRVLDARRHRRKLQRGGLRGNRFRITLRDVEGDRGALDERLTAIRRHGVPNYFGEQRFGRGGGNVERARALLGGNDARAQRRGGRDERGILLSAVRSSLFNELLGERVRRGDWNRPLAGDVFMLAGSQSIFGPEPIDAALAARVESGDIAPTGPLFGLGELRAEGEAGALEATVAGRHADRLALLERNGLRQERRSLVLRVSELELDSPATAGLVLSFYLRKGSYATVIIREIVSSPDVLSEAE